MKNLLLASLLIISLLTACDKADLEPANYTVNSATSVAEWKGSAPDHFHVGSFQVKGSLAATPQGQIKAGRFTIPIASIQNFDLPAEVKGQLLDHLKSPDFFNLALHPNAEFTITQVSPYTGQPQEAVPGANTLLTGDFTMLGQTHPISFPARVTQTADSLKAEATFKLDRTKWGMTKYSNPQEPMYILPDADISLKLQAAVQ